MSNLADRSSAWRSQRLFAIAASACLVLWLGALGVASEQATPASRPNIVLMFPDNLGWGEVNVYGGVRGAITPRLDRLAAEGLRLNNFNVEFSCTVSRAALMTGRYAIRTGATQAAGITLWEVTIAEALQSIGYATGLFGKWHLGGDRPENRNPSQQGFDEYYGIPRTSNEAQTTIAQGQTAPNTSFIWEGRTGSPPRNVKPFDLQTRRTIDRESAEKARRVHGAQRPRQEALLRLLPDDADSLPDADPSRLRREDRRGRHRRRDGRGGRQRRPHARRHRSARHRAQHDRVLVHRQRRRRPAAVARIVGALVGFLQQRHGGRHPDAVPGPLARENSGGPRHQRAGARDRSLPDHRRRGRRGHRAARSRDRRRQPAPVLRGQAGDVEPRVGAALRQRAAARGEVARLEAALRVCPGGRRPAGRAVDAALQSAVRSQRRDRHQGREPVGAERHGPDRERVHRHDPALSARAAQRAGSRICHPRCREVAVERREFIAMLASTPAVSLAERRRTRRRPRQRRRRSRSASRCSAPAHRRRRWTVRAPAISSRSATM